MRTEKPTPPKERGRGKRQKEPASDDVKKKSHRGTGTFLPLCEWGLSSSSSLFLFASSVQVGV